MSQKQLGILLSKLKVFTKPSMQLEQYPTPAKEAAIILWDAYMKGHIEDKVVLDLGCGGGILGIGALILGAKKVIFVEKDSSLEALFRENIAFAEEYVGEDFADLFEIMFEDVADIADLQVDTCIMNPPFGTKEKHIDALFLEKACGFAKHVYSYHKDATREFLAEKAKSLGFMLIESFMFTFKLGSTMHKHKKKKHEVGVVCLHLAKS